MFFEKINLVPFLKGYFGIFQFLSCFFFLFFIHKQIPKFLLLEKSYEAIHSYCRVSVSPPRTSLGGGMLEPLQQLPCRKQWLLWSERRVRYCKEATTPPALPCSTFFQFNNLHSFCSLTDPSFQRLYCWYHWICFARNRKTREKVNLLVFWLVLNLLEFWFV